MEPSSSSHCLGSPCVPNTPSRFGKPRRRRRQRDSSPPPGAVQTQGLFEQGNAVAQGKEEVKEEAEEEKKEEDEQEIIPARVRRSKRLRQ